MRQGMSRVVNLSYIALFQWYELEKLVCGSPVIDIDNLRKHTTYRGGLSASHPVCRNLFRALTSFSNDERRLFLQFVWGRSRLPQHHSDWVQVRAPVPASSPSFPFLPLPLPLPSSPDPPPPTFHLNLDPELRDVFLCDLAAPLLLCWPHSLSRLPSGPCRRPLVATTTKCCPCHTPASSGARRPSRVGWCAATCGPGVVSTVALVLSFVWFGAGQPGHAAVQLLPNPAVQGAVRDQQLPGHRRGLHARLGGHVVMGVKLQSAFCCVCVTSPSLPLHTHPAPFVGIAASCRPPPTPPPPPPPRPQCL
jgi:hypothetical protein